MVLATCLAAAALMCPPLSHSQYFLPQLGIRHCIHSSHGLTLFILDCHVWNVNSSHCKGYTSKHISTDKYKFLYHYILHHHQLEQLNLSHLWLLFQLSWEASCTIFPPDAGWSGSCCWCPSSFARSPWTAYSSPHWGGCLATMEQTAPLS